MPAAFVTFLVMLADHLMLVVVFSNAAVFIVVLAHDRAGVLAVNADAARTDLNVLSESRAKHQHPGSSCQGKSCSYKFHLRLSSKCCRRNAFVAGSVPFSEPIREVWIDDQEDADRRLSMRRIMAKRTKAAAVLV